MQQGLGLGAFVEIARLAPENQIGNKPGAGGNMLAQLRKIIGKEKHPTQRVSRDEDKQQGRENTPDPPPIKRGKAELMPIQAFEDYRGNKIAGDDKKDIDANEPAAH